MLVVRAQGITGEEFWGGGGWGGGGGGEGNLVSPLLQKFIQLRVP